MKLLSYTLLLFCLVATPAKAAEAYEYNIYESVGNSSGKGLNDFTMTVGGGVEMRIKNGFGVETDLAYSFLNRHDDFGIFSVGPFYNFQSAKKVIPFIDGGYASTFRNDQTNLIYFGGGVDYWPAKKMGLKVAVRNYISTDDPAKFNLTQFKVGLLFR